MSKLTCRFCPKEFEKGWNAKQGASGIDLMIMHVRQAHFKEYNKLKAYAKKTTLEKEKQYVQMMNAYQHDKNI